MEDAHQTSSSNPLAADTEAQTAARQDEATSSDTLSDVEDTLSDSGSSPSAGSDSSSSNETPAPDGTPDAGDGYGGDVRDQSGPM